MNQGFAERVRGGAKCCGTWLSLGSPVVAELCAEIGFDWLLVDLEHGGAGEESVLPILHAVRGSNTATIVRVGAPEPSQIARILDWGADGIMVPHVSTPEQAADCVSAMRFPPQGTRGFSRSARAFGYGLRPPSSVDDVQLPIFLAQIEDLKGVCRAHSIAQVDGVDVLFIGPSDLRLALSCNKDPATPGFEDAVNAVAGEARSAGKAAGILLRDVSELEQTLERGISFVAVHSDLAILRSGYQAIPLQRFHSTNT